VWSDEARCCVHITLRQRHSGVVRTLPNYDQSSTRQYITPPVLVKEPQKQRKMAYTVRICQNATHLKPHSTYLPYDSA
jgi:hypothetical protein